jgi:hypothetical protein
MKRLPIRYVLKAYVVSRGKKKEKSKFETRFDLEFEDDEEIVELKSIYS